MDYRYLKAFQIAARHLNFSKAAQELKISPSALGRQIALLEQSCGGELFIRNTRNVILTPSGKSLFETTTRFESDVAALDQEKPLRIGCLQSVFEFMVVDLMRRHPECFEGPLDIFFDTPLGLQKSADAGELDLLFTVLEPKASCPLSSFRLVQENVSWIGPKSSKRAIVFSAFDHFYSPEDLKTPNRIRVNSFSATVAMAKQQIGRALMARPALKGTVKKGLGRQWIYLGILNYEKMPARLSKLVAMLRREFRQPF